MSLTALVDGRGTTQIDVRDRGLAYGDGIFRTLKVIDGKPVAWPAHWARLAHDCERMDLVLPDQSLLRDEARRLFEPQDDGVLKIILTRGSGGRGYAPPETPECTRVLQRFALPPAPEKTGMKIGLCQTRLGCNPQLAGVKHLNRLEQVLARRECAQAGWPEALMCDATGRVISGTMSNLFLIKAGQLVTPELDQAGVAGATRQRILAAAALHGKTVVEREISLADCLAADALFLCNSLMGVRPVTRLQNHAIPESGMTRWCQQQLEQEEY